MQVDAVVRAPRSVVSGRALRAAPVWMSLACVALTAAVVAARPALPGTDADLRRLESLLLWSSLAPRCVLALVCGAALGMSGALLQRVLRNPLADPSTLGVASGAQLALVAAGLYAPALLAASREAVALAGGTLGVGLVLAATSRRAFDPASVLLAGMVVSITAAACAAALILSRGEYALSIYIWGAGSLHQQSWDATLALLPRALAGVALALLLVRPLSLFVLDDSSSRSLGLAVGLVRPLAIGVAVWLAASVTAIAGVIGFIGLAAPALARASGARTMRAALLASAGLGALLLSIADSLVQVLGSASSDLLPTGAATALIGGPLLIKLIPQARPHRIADLAPPRRSGRRMRPGVRSMAALAALMCAMIFVALVIGARADGWSFASGDMAAQMFALRWPRIVVAAAAGVMLASAGVVMQRVTRNPLAGPEVLGVSAGAGAGLAIALFVAGSASLATQAAGLFSGALASMALVLALAGGARSPTRLLLTGVGVGAMATAIVSIAMTQGDARAFALLAWMSGSTHDADAFQAAFAAVACALLAPPLLVVTRWLELLPLGRDAAQSLGLPASFAQIALAGAAALLTACAAFLVGPLSLVGLIAPHVARLAGFFGARAQLVAAMTIGAALMLAADWLSRNAAYPYEIPVGVCAALIGGPYLMWILSRRSDDHG